MNSHSHTNIFWCYNSIRRSIDFTTALLFLIHIFYISLLGHIFSSMQMFFMNINGVKGVLTDTQQGGEVYIGTFDVFATFSTLDTFLTRILNKTTMCCQGTNNSDLHILLQNCSTYLVLYIYIFHQSYKQ